VSIILAWIDYQNNCGKLAGQLKTLDEDQKLVWFGQGGTYQVGQDSSQMVVSGIYNPNTIMRLAIWEKEGIKGLGGQGITFSTLFDVWGKLE